MGAVVGATYPEMGKVLRKIMPKAYILVPGYGAQGGKGKDLVHFFNEDGLGAIINSSRGIIAAWQQEKYASFGAEQLWRGFQRSGAGYDGKISRRRWKAEDREIAKKENSMSKYKEHAVVCSQEQIADRYLEPVDPDGRDCSGKQDRDSFCPCIPETGPNCFRVPSVSVRSIGRAGASAWFTG